MPSILSWTFCPSCGRTLSSFIPEGGGNPTALCQACGFRDFESPWPGTTVILENGAGEILLLRRSIAPCLGEWDLPGGFINGGETGEEGARREVQEELGITPALECFLGAFPSIYGESERATLALTYLMVLTPEEEASITLDLEENSEARWFAPEALPEVAFADGRLAVEAWRALRRR